MENLRSTFEIIKDIILIVFGGIGSFVAIAGLRAWKVQLKGKSDYELAKRLLKNIYSLRQRIEWFRNPLIMADEYITAKKEQNISDMLDESRIENTVVYNKRWNDIVEVYNELNVDKIESEVTWGKEISREIDRIRALLTDLKISLQEMLSLHRKDSLSEKLLEHLENYENIVYDRGTKDIPDDFSKKLNDHIKTLEGLIKPYLR